MFRITETQLGMYLQGVANRDSLQYNICGYARLPLAVDFVRLERALRETVAAHSVFHMRLIEQGGAIWQDFDATAEIPIAHQTLPDEAQVEGCLSAFPRPFDLFGGELLRFVLVETPTAKFLGFDISHLVFDGTTLVRFFGEVGARYDARPVADEGATYAEFAIDEERSFETPAYAEAAADAKSRFADLSPTLPEDATAESSSPNASFLCAEVALPATDIEACCRALDVTPNLFFMGVFSRVLGVFANTGTTLFTTVNHGRREAAFRHTMGACVKMVPVRGETAGEKVLGDYLRSFKLHRAGVYPFTHGARDFGLKPGFIFVFQEGTVDLKMRLADAECPLVLIRPGGESELPTLQLYANEREGVRQYQCRMSCVPGAYSEGFLRRFLALFASVARNFTEHPTARLDAIPLLDAPQIAELKTLSRGEDLPYDAERTFVDLVHAQAVARPEATAVVDCESSLTYGELDARSDALAAILSSAGVAAGAFVGLMLPRRLSFVVSLLGVEKCGAGYVPIDAEYPIDRIAYMLSDSCAGVLITTRALFHGKDLAFKGKVLFYEDLDLRSGEVDNANPSSPAYMIYTSGSTGRPKGAVIPQRAVVALCAWMKAAFELDADRRIATHASFSFDASVIDIFPALASGAELHIYSEDVRTDLAAIRDYIVVHRITGTTMSTQIGLALINTFPDIPLRYLLLGGEKMLPTAKTAVRVVNGYGPTEFCVCSSYQVVDPSADGDIPIGRPVPNSSSYICDVLGQLVPRGMTGELCLAGAQMAEGYWHRPARTSAAFVSRDYAEGGRLYRTGDLARYNGAGQLEYRGRIDFQVKLRGYRIELGEVERVAALEPGIGTAVAQIREIAGSRHLVLYYTGDVARDALKAKMSAQLADYMVPDFFVRVDAMPMTLNGKVDRAALPIPEMADEAFEPPANAREAEVLAIAQSVLKADCFGVTHDFLRSGLTSLGAMTLVARLREQAGMTVTMRQLVDYPTVRALVSTLDGTDEAEKASAHVKVARRRPKRSTYPMTENQRGIYADWLRNPTALQYNVPAAVRFPGADAHALADAAVRAFDAHPAFKTCFVEKKGEMVQCRRDDVQIDVPVEAVTTEPDVALFGRQMRPFSPTGDRLARAKVLAAPSAAYLLLDVHHTIFDGVSLGVFLADVVRVLEGGEPKGEKSTAFDAALDERDYLESDLLAEDDAWFARYLSGCESTRVETSRAGATGNPGTCGRVAARLESATILRRCRELGVSASDWFLTAFMELLRRVGRSEDVQVAFVSAGRTHSELAETVGMFVRTLPVRNDRSAKTFSEAVRHLRGDVCDLIDRERYSYARVCEKFGLRPEIIFAFEDALFDLPPGVKLITPASGAAKCPLSVLVTPGKDDFELAFEYDASLYSERDMSLLLGLFRTLARFAAHTDDLRKIPLVPRDEAEEIVRFSSGEPIDYDAERTFVDLVHAQAVARPAATAVVDCESSLTYGELDARSDALASLLASSGVKPGAFVGLMLPRRLSFVVSLLGVEKCGAGYVPIDAEYPIDRIAYMLADSCAGVLITTRALFHGKDLAFRGKVLFYEDLGLREVVNLHSTTTTQNVNASSPAYMIYTSGSTGRPKGVVISQRAVRHVCAWFPPAVGLTADSRIATHASFSFDASVIDIFPALASGAELHIYAAKVRRDLAAIRDYIVTHRITGTTMSTQIGRALVDTFPDIPLRYLLLGGEKMLPTAKTAVRVINGYGPTEFCVCSSYQLVDASMTDDLPIGRPVPGTASFVVDRYAHLLPRGFVGEIALAGPQMAEGYWRNPAKTDESFVTLPSALRLYRTGDLGRYDDAGRLMYLGRVDFQVKLRGYRIEIGEVEHVASKFPGMGEVAAEVREVLGAKHLVLYYASPVPVDEQALKAKMSAQLADYMVPDFFVRMDAMPMTANGKINRKVLPIPNPTPAEAFVEPQAGTESVIAAAYAEVLGLARFGATADFFQSGGTSLLGIKAVVALQKRGLEVQYGDLFKYKTPRALTAFLQPSASPSSTPPAFAYGAYDYTRIDALLASTRSDLFNAFHVHPLGTVLLTGATGYLGVHVLRELLEKTTSNVVALVRPKGKTSPDRRLDAQYVYYFGQRLPDALRARITFVAGDLTDPDLGEKLKGLSIQTVLNCAAIVKHYVADDAMDRVNVGGVENLIGWCAKSKACLVHASTYSVGGMVGASSPAVLSERALFVGQDSDNDYVRTKFLAERAILAAIAEGRIRGKVMRLGNLMGRESDGEFQMNVGANAFVSALKSYKAIGAFPLEELAGRVEMSPIDRVAEAVCLLATTPDDMVVFHPFNAYALDMGAVLSALVRRGYEVAWVSRADFAAHVEALRNDASRVRDLKGILHYARHHLGDEKVTPVVNAWTTTVLYRLGFRWKPAEDRYLANFFDMLDGLAVFG